MSGGVLMGGGVLFVVSRWVLGCALATGLTLGGPGVRVAQAGLVATQTVLQAELGSESDARARVELWLARADVRRELQSLGVSPDEADARVAHLSDAEVTLLAQRIDELPAGGSFAGAVAGVLLALFLLFVITDLLGFTDVFPFINPLPRGQAGSR